MSNKKSIDIHLGYTYILFTGIRKTREKSKTYVTKNTSRVMFFTFLFVLCECTITKYVIGVQ